MRLIIFSIAFCFCMSFLTCTAKEGSELKFEKVFPELSFDRAIGFVDLGESEEFLVLEQWGRVYLCSLKDRSQKKLVLDIKSRLSMKNEEGLLSLVLDPMFKSNSYVYLYYSAKKGGRHSVVSRMKYSAGKVDLNSEVILLEVDQPYWNHNGGQLAFGADKMLYISLGDGGAGGDPHKHGQDKSTLLASILRIDVRGKSQGKNYIIPRDNPFVGEKNVRSEIYAYGLRNPWRFSFDALKGDLYCADVGQNKQEEVNLIVSGGNYGWRVREGDLAFKAKEKKPGERYLEPIFTYGRRQGISITGGYVFRGDKNSKYYGHYFCADYVTGQFYMIDTKTGKSKDLGRYPFNPASFAEDSQGQVYICDYKKGNIFKIKL